MKELSALSDAALDENQADEKSWGTETETILVPNNAEVQLVHVALVYADPRRKHRQQSQEEGMSVWLGSTTKRHNSLTLPQPRDKMLV